MNIPNIPRKALVPALACLGISVVLVCLGSARSGTHSPAWGDLGWRLLTFGFFVGILWWAAGDKLLAALGSRRAAIAGELDALELAKRQAERQLRDVSERIAELETQRREILEEGRARAEALGREIVVQAERQAEEVLAQARRTAENEARALVLSLRVRMADEVVSAVERGLSGQLDAGGHDRLIDKALRKVVLQ
jgi:F-type H+-transporting ATPase subunit b